jgi:hypothetical protein
MKITHIFKVNLKLSLSEHIRLKWQGYGLLGFDVGLVVNGRIILEQILGKEGGKV